MRLSTSTNLVFDRPDGSIIPMTEMMRIAKAAGFERLDISFYDWALPHSPFLTDSWRAWIEEIAEEQARLGLSFEQCHGYTYAFLDNTLSDEERAYHEMLEMRAIECCRIVGAKTCVTHPDTDFSTVRAEKVSREKNIAYFTKLLEKTENCGMRFAVENMCDITIAPKRKYCAYPEELCELCDSIGSDRLGICWDFEHADIMQQNQRESLLLIGKRLMATHVSDTHSATDPTLMHVMPLSGSIDWKEAVAALKEIGYDGCFSFEVSNYGRYFPDELVMDATRLAYRIGEYLMKL